MFKRFCTYNTKYTVPGTLSIIFLCVFASCQLISETDQDISSEKYLLQLNPSHNSKYTYKIENNLKIILSVDEKEQTTSNSSNVEVTYHITTDTGGKYLFESKYNLIEINTKANGVESNMTTNNPYPTNAAEKMLFLLKSSPGKQKLQKLVFPEGIRYHKANNVVQTPRINSLFSLIQPPDRVTAKKEKGNLSQSCLKSDSVTPSGFKPTRIYQSVPYTPLVIEPADLRCIVDRVDKLTG